MAAEEGRGRVGWTDTRIYYRRLRHLTLGALSAHIREQVAVSLVVALVAGLLAWLAGAGAGSLVYGVAGFAVWILGAAAFYGVRAPVELDRAVRSERDAALGERDAALAAKESLRLEFEALAAEELPGQYLQTHVARPLYEVRFLVRNLGPGGTFEAKVLSKSVHGVGEEYPQGAFWLAWQLSEEASQRIPNMDDARVELAAVVPSARVLRFMLPGAHGKLLTAQTQVVRGLIDIFDTEHDQRQRISFDLHIDPAHPPRLEVAEVDTLPA